MDALFSALGVHVPFATDAQAPHLVFFFTKCKRSARCLHYENPRCTVSIRVSVVHLHHLKAITCLSLKSKCLMVYLVGIIISLFLFLLLLIKKDKSVADKILTVWMLGVGVHQLIFYLDFSKIKNTPGTSRWGKSRTVSYSRFYSVRSRHKTRLFSPCCG